MVITDFTNLARQHWIIVNDGVMGGKSTSRFQVNEKGNGVFLGTVSLKNNGGFASVKNHEPIHLSGYNTIKLTLRGDGKRFSFRLQTGTDGNVNKWSYQQRFDTENKKWISVNLALNRFEPTFRGKIPENVPEMDTSKIMRYGFLISDNQEGDFRLEVDKIEAIRK